MSLRALSNIWGDLRAQRAVRGALALRLGFVALYYGLYAAARLLLRQDQGRAHLFSRRLLWRLGLTGREITIVHPSGVLMDVDLFAACFLVKELCLERGYSRLESFRPRAGQTVVDVGAHQGVFTLEAAAAVGPGGKVVSVEPCPANFRRLSRNVERGGLRQVTPVPRAADEKPGRVTLYIDEIISGGQSLEPAPGRPSVEVEAQTLDAILESCGAARPDLIKIDVEGAALRVLAGAARALAGRPRLVMEVEGGPAEVEKMRARLTELGYGCRIFDSVLYAEPEGARP